MRTPLALTVPLSALLALSACSSGSGSADSLKATSTPPVTAGTTSTTPTPATGVRGAGGTSGTAGGSGAKPAPAGPSGSAAAAPAGTLAAPGTAAKGPGAAARSKATAPGDYQLDSSGTVRIGVSTQDASGTETLTIAPVANRRQRSTLHSDSTGDTVEDLVVRDDGSLLASLTLTSPAFTKSFRPATPVLLVPDPATLGRSYSWTVTSTDGKTKATASSTLSRNETLRIGGRQVPCVVVTTHLVLSGDISYDAQMTTWWAPALRLPVQTHTVGKGTAFNTPFKTDITAVMRSTTPS